MLEIFKLYKVNYSKDWLNYILKEHFLMDKI